MHNVLTIAALHMTTMFTLMLIFASSKSALSPMLLGLSASRIALKLKSQGYGPSFFAIKALQFKTYV